MKIDKATKQGLVAEMEQRVRAKAVAAKRDALQQALNTIADVAERLPELLAAYERTGDHDHSVKGNRPIFPGDTCPGGDCNVARARKVIAALNVKES